MSKQLRLRVLAASVGVLSLIHSGCQNKPKVAPSAPANPIAAAPVPLPPSEKPSFKRGTIFFIKGDATISPGALDKLNTWTTAWGKDGKWVIAYPSNPEIASALNEKRILVLRSELQKLGVAIVETKILPNEPAGQYDAIHIEK